MTKTKAIDFRLCVSQIKNYIVKLFENNFNILIHTQVFLQAKFVNQTLQKQKYDDDKDKSN